MTALRAVRAPSKRLVLSYIFDWIIIVAIWGTGGGFNYLSPFHRPFSLLDLDVSFPYKVKETIPTWLLVVVGLLIPAAVVLLVCLIFVPGPGASRRAPASLLWRRKLWEWNTGWMGLALSVGAAFLITNALKNLFGKPRPDLLSRCQPNLADLGASTIGGYGQDISARWTLVSWDICLQADRELLDDGFRSFPSGHSSFSFAGLIYLTLFLASKFQITIPYLAPRAFSRDPAHTSFGPVSANQKGSLLPTYRTSAESSTSGAKDLPPSRINANVNAYTRPADLNAIVPIRNQTAAPPAYLLVVAFVPVAAALYISSTRYTDFRHHGFDIICGALIGIATAWFSFRWYHLPVRRGAGWSWGARSRDRAWGIPNGVDGYVGPEGWASSKANNEDPESVGLAERGGLTGAGMSDGTGGYTSNAHSQGL